MSRQEINIGVEGNDGTGDSIRESFRKTNENFTELYAIFGEGGQISLTDLGNIAIDSFENFPSTEEQPILAGINVGVKGSTLEFFRLASNSFLDENDEDTIEFDASGTDGDGRPVIVVKATKSSVVSDVNPALGGNLNMGNKIAVSTLDPDEWANEVENLNDRDVNANTSATIDNVLITKGYADQNYLKASGSGTGAQLRVRTEDEISIEDYTFTINSISSNNFVINDRYENGVLISANGHGLDSAANGAEFIYQTTGNSAVDGGGDPLTDTTIYPETRFFIRVVNDSQLSIHPTKEDALAGTNKISVSGGSGTQSLVDYYYRPDDLSGLYLANEAVSRESVVRRQGDSMTGTLYLNDHPGELEGAGTPNGIEDLQAATKFYVDNTSYTSNINLFVSLNGDDTQANTPAGKEGRSLAYAFRTVNAAARRAEEIIEASPVEPGPYMQKIEFGPDEQNLQPTWIVDAGFSGAAENYGSGQEKFPLLLDQNIDFIKAETIAWVTQQIEEANANLALQPGDADYIWKNFAYDEDICARDIGLIVNAAKLDTVGKLAGANTNKLSRLSGIRYYKNASGRLAAITQKDQTIATINKVVDIVENYILPEVDYSSASLQSDFTQFVDNDDATPVPQDMIDIWVNNVGIVTSIIDGGGIDAAPTLNEGAPYVIKIANGGNDSVWQGQAANTDLIPGKVVKGTTSGAVGRIVTYSRDLDAPVPDPQGNNVQCDQIEMILEEPFEFLIKGDGRSIQNVTVSNIVGDELEFGNIVSTTNITIKVESGTFYEDYPIRLPAQVSILGDEMRRTVIRPRDRVSQSKWANVYFYRDKYFDGLTLHDNTVNFERETVLELDAPITGNVYVGDVITQTNTFTYNEARCRRDLDYVLTAAGYDIALGTNYNAITQGLAYQRPSGAVVQNDQLSQELASIAFARDKVLQLSNVSDLTLAEDRAEAYFNEVIDIVKNGNELTYDAANSYTFPANPNGDTNKANARDILQANKSFLVEEVIKHITNDYPGGTPPAGWDGDRLSFDVAQWIDALTYDILYTSNVASSTQARLYFTGGSPTGGTFNISAAQKAVTVEATDHLQSIITSILQNSLITRATQNNLTQNVDQDAATAAEGSEAASLLGIIESAVNSESDASLGSPTYPSVTWTAQALRDAKTDIENNLASSDTEVNIIDLTIEFIDSNTGTRATVQEKGINPSQLVVTYDDGYVPNGENVTPSSSFNPGEEIIINGTPAGVNVSATYDITDENHIKDFNMGWHYAKDSRKPVKTSAEAIDPSLGNTGGYVKAAEILKQNKQQIQEAVYQYMDNEATAARDAGFGLWAETTLVLAGNVDGLISKGDTVKLQGGNSPTGTVKNDPVGELQSTIVVVSPTDTFTAGYNLAVVDADGNETDIGVASNVDSISVGKFTFSLKCKRDIGYIVDALVYDLEKGRNDQALEVQGRYYEGAVETGQEEITSEAITQIASIATPLLNINGSVAPNTTDFGTQTWKLDFPAAESGSSGVVGNLIDVIIYAFDEDYNPPKNNKEMDVFLMNDATLIRQCTIQGHGGFMTVLDPEGQILTKSPYIQNGSSFSQSANKQAFRGGMFVDGFVGNMPIEIVGQVDGNPFILYARSKRSETTVGGLNVGHGLFVRRPQLPAPFYVNGIRYQVNAIRNHSLINGTCELILDAKSGVDRGNNDWSGWIGPVTHYTIVDGVRTPQYGEKNNYPTTLQTAGNRSQLGNDFTQINDLGYGLLVTNTGLSEMVGMFTYYCHAAYYANNGAEIRSVGGSNAYGNFGLVASGSDPNEVAQAGELAYNTVQTGKVYVDEARSFLADEEQSFIYVYDTDFTPLPEGEIDITFQVRQPITTFNGSNSVRIVGHGFTQGQKIQIADCAIDGRLPISDFTGTNRVKVVGHGYSNGEQIEISNVSKANATAGEQTIMDALNDTHYIQYVDADTFDLYTDAGLTTAFNAAIGTLTFATGDSRGVASLTGIQTEIDKINGDHYVNVVDANNFELYSDAGLTTARSINFAYLRFASGDTRGGAFPADGEGTDIRKYEVVNVIPAFIEDSVPGVNQIELTLSGNVILNYGDIITQANTGATGRVIVPEKTSGGVTGDGDPIIVGSDVIYVSQADGATAFSENVSADTLTITDVYNGTDSTEDTDGNAFYITALDDSADTSGLPLVAGTDVNGDPIEPNGNVWKLTFSNQTETQGATTGGLVAKLFGGESVTIRQRAKVIIDQVETAPTRPSTAVVFADSNNVYRSIAFNEDSITDWGGLESATLPGGNNLITFDKNYNYLLPTVSYDNYSVEAKLTIPEATLVTANKGDTVVQGSATGVLASTIGESNVVYVTNVSGTFSTSGGNLTIDGDTIVNSEPTEVLDFSADGTFGFTAGDTRVAIGAPFTEADALNRLSEGTMIFGWRDRVHVVLAYHDGSGTAYGNPAGTSLQTGFPYLELEENALIDKNNESAPNPPSTGIARPLRLDNEGGTVTLSLGSQDDVGAEITVNISLTRATGHDFSNIGTGGFNTSNYPNVLLGDPQQAKTQNFHSTADEEETAQVWEKGKGRVFYASTDEDGFFRVGEFFEVDQGTGTVKFAAQINISGLDGLGFRDGETITKFTGDNGMSPIDNDTVPTSYSVQQYLDRRLGYDANMVPKVGRIGDGFLPQKNPVLTQTLDGLGNPDHTLNMQSGRIVQLEDPINDLDATNKQYVDRRVFANDEIQELRDIELNNITYESNYGKNNLIVMTGNKRIYVDNNAVSNGAFEVGDIITGYSTASAAEIADLEDKTLDNGVNVTIISYKPLKQYVLTLDSAPGITINRGMTVTQTNTGAEGIVLWGPGQSDGSGNTTKTENNQIILHTVTGTFSTGVSADTLDVYSPTLDTTTNTALYVNTIVEPAVIDFEQERIENSARDWRQTTGGFPGAPVSVTPEFGNAVEANDPALHDEPGTATRSDINIIVTRLPGDPTATPDPYGGKTEINLQLQEEAVMNADVNTYADIAQEKLNMDNAPVLSNSNSFEDGTYNGQRVKQANQGVAAFDATTFAEDQVWTLTGNITDLAVGDILTQSSGARTAYVVRIISTTTGNHKIKVRTADSFAIGNAAVNRLTRTQVNEDDYTLDQQAQSTVTISAILNTGYINIKDRGITFDKIQNLPERTVIGRADIDFDGEDEGAGEFGITRAIPFSQIVDEGGALQDKDFSDSNLVKLAGTELITNYEFNAQTGDIISQVGNTTAKGVVQGDVNSENRVILVGTDAQALTGTFNTTGQLTLNGSPITGGFGNSFNIIPSSITTGVNLLGSALIKVKEDTSTGKTQYGTINISKTGSGDSILRTYADGDTVSGIDNTLNLEGWINPRGLMLDSNRVADTANGILTVYTPGDHVSLNIEGSAPTGSNPDKSTIKIPTASLQLGSTIITKDDLGTGFEGYASQFQRNAGGGMSEPYLVTPWVYTNFIQARGELDGEGTGISIGQVSGRTNADEIYLIVKGSNALQVTYSSTKILTTNEERITVTDSDTTIKNNLKIGSTTKFSVAANTGNTRIYGDLTVDGTYTANAGITVDNSVFDADKITRAGGDFEIETTTSGNIILEAAGENINFKGAAADTRIGFAIANDSQSLTAQGAFEITNAGSTTKGITVTATGDITLDAAGDIILDADGADIKMQDGGTDFLTFNNTTAGVDIHHTEQDKVLRIRGNDNGTDFTAISIDMADAGSTTFNNDVTIEGNILVKGNIDLGDSVSADTMNIEAIIAQDNLTMKRTNADDQPFNLILQHSTTSSAIGDEHGKLSFYGTNNVNNAANDDSIRSSIRAEARAINNGLEKSSIIFSTASGTRTEADRLTINDAGITSSVNLLPSAGSETIGASGDAWDAVYADDYYGVFRGNVKDNNTTARDVLTLGTSHPSDADPNSANYTTFYGKLVGILDGNSEFASKADSIKTGESGDGAGSYYIPFVTSNNPNTSPDYEQVYTHTTLKFAPNLDRVYASSFDGDLIGDVLGGDTIGGDGSTIVINVGNDSASVTGQVSDISNHDTGDLPEDSNGTYSSGTWYFTRSRAGDAFKAGTGITISGEDSNDQRTISMNSAEVVASTANAVKVTNTNEDQAFYPIFVDGAGNAESVYSDTSGISYNASTNILTTTASQAQYADLAEKYVADDAYEPGTVVVFGGENEITVCTEKGDRKVAGVVSTKPAFIMNGDLEGDNIIDLALQGRVPCKVIGTVRKGDMLVTSAVPGYAIVDNDPKIGTVIGKAVENKDDDGKGVVEVVVGRL
jgi:hypothetical protein